MCTATWCDSIHVVIPVPVCNAHFIHYAGSYPAEVHFYGAINPPGTTFAWSFGDNSTSDGHSPTHTYSQSGTYYACLTVTDSVNGTILCTATWCDSIHVVIPPPVCNAHFHSHRGTNLGSVYFNAAFNPPGTTYAWNFGDGTTGTGHATTHTYSQFGAYNVCLTVTDSSGGTILCSANWCDSVRVLAPVCNAEFDHSCGHHSMNIRFEPEREHNSSYAWDFGDNTFSSQPEPTHQYGQPGAYNVCLTVTDSFAGSIACTATWCDTVFAGKHHGCHSHFHDYDRLRQNTDLDNSDAVTAMIYPNPISENSVLHLENTTGNVTFSVFESTGKLVMMRKNLTDGDIQLNRGDLGQGIYFFRINDDTGNVVNGKFIVQ